MIQHKPLAKRLVRMVGLTPELPDYAMVDPGFGNSAPGRLR
jgi:hypothetical protein